ncbi:MAG: FixH family protein [Chloroflexi bacterium]|nr:FixH family protein [Chloroflexota bacterium]
MPHADWRPLAGRLGRRPFLASLLGLVALACQQPAPQPPSPRPQSAGLKPSASPASAPFTVVLPASDLAVGKNRFLLALLDQTNKPISSAEVRLRFFKLEGGQGTLKGEGEARYYGTGLGDRGVYVARTAFDAPGAWGVEVAVRRDGQDLGAARHSFEVQADSLTPALGAGIPASAIPTATSAAEIEKICSARPVDDFHSLSIADALAAGKPFLLLFASPGFCRSQTCGPSLQVVQGLRDLHGDRLNYLHVEVYQDPDQGAPGLKPVPAVVEWNLPSEPWLFLVDARGKVFDKFEGGITVEETTPATEALLGATRS